jgi:hypothetical protein
MEPNLIRPTMSGYLANRTRHTQRATPPDERPALRPSRAARARHASGALLIAIGRRVAGIPQPAYRETTDDPATSVS